MILVIPDVTYYAYGATEGTNGSIYWWEEDGYHFLAYRDDPLVTSRQITDRAYATSPYPMRPELVGIMLTVSEASLLACHLRQQSDTSERLHLNLTGQLTTNTVDMRHSSINLQVNRTNDDYGDMVIRLFTSKSSIARFVLINVEEARFLAEHLEGHHSVNSPYEYRRSTSGAYN